MRRFLLQKSEQLSSLAVQSFFRQAKEKNKQVVHFFSFICITYGSVSTLWTTHPLISGQGFLYYLLDFCHFSRCSALTTLEKSFKMLKIWQKMKKNLIQKFTDESSVKYTYRSVSKAGELDQSKFFDKKLVKKNCIFFPKLVPSIISSSSWSRETRDVDN